MVHIKNLREADAPKQAARQSYVKASKGQGTLPLFLFMTTMQPLNIQFAVVAFNV